MAENEEEYEVLDLTALRRNRTYIQKILGDVTKKSAAQQVVIGGGSGWLANYVAVKVGKSAAITIGATILVVRIAQHQGYIRVDWSRINNEMAKARRTVEREAARHYPGTVNSVTKFVQDNVLLAGSFGIGFLIGAVF